MCQAVYLVDDNAVIAVDCGFQRHVVDDVQALAAFNAHDDTHSAEARAR